MRKSFDTEFMAKVALDAIREEKYGGLVCQDHLLLLFRCINSSIYRVQKGNGRSP